MDSVESEKNSQTLTEKRKVKWMVGQVFQTNGSRIPVILKLGSLKWLMKESPIDTIDYLNQVWLFLEVSALHSRVKQSLGQFQEQFIWVEMRWIQLYITMSWKQSYIGSQARWTMNIFMCLFRADLWIDVLSHTLLAAASTDNPPTYLPEKDC